MSDGEAKESGAATEAAAAEADAAVDMAARGWEGRENSRAAVIGE